MLAATVVLCAALLVSAHPALADFVQQGPKLVGTGAVGSYEPGYSIAISADGNTAILGGPNDNNSAGAVWVFTRSGGVWTQQGSKLVGTGALPPYPAGQGASVALSADGNTAVVGGPGDNYSTGAVWVFTRSGGIWTQEGSKLIGSDAVGNAFQGTSVAVSGDGSTAIVGGSYDNTNTGATWVFTRNGGVWSQQGSKLIGTGAVGIAGQGHSVALSSDGNTAIVGGHYDSGSTGATWVFTRSGGVWTQQGSKLVGTGGVENSDQGWSVALSADGNTAIVGADGDGGNDNGNCDGSIGAVWIFTLSGDVWTQEGNKLVGNAPHQCGNRGNSVALSGDGNIAIVGAPTYVGELGKFGAALVFTRTNGVWTEQGSPLIGSGAVAGSEQGFSGALSADGSTAIFGDPVTGVWVFIQSTISSSLAATHDFNGDGKSDILWRNSSNGATVGWLMNGGTVTSSATIATVPTNWQIIAQRDFNGDGKADILWRDTTTGTVVLWLLNGLQVTQSITIGTVPTNWVLSGVGDFNGDGKADLLWRDSNTGTVAIWLMDGGAVVQAGNVGTVSSNWDIVGTNPKGHIVWRDSTSGSTVIWVMNAFSISQSYSLGAVPLRWVVVGVGDFEGSGSIDLLWRDSASGTVAISLINNRSVRQSKSLGVVANDWSVDLTGDFNGDGMSDIVLTNTTTGARSIWFMNGASVTSTASLGTVPTAWVIQSNSAE
jgi:hypothetical protein